MQSKGLTKFFLYLLIIVCGYQLMLMIPTSSVERKAEAAAAIKAKEFLTSSRPEYKGKSEEALTKIFRSEYIDNISEDNIVDFAGIKYTYSKLKGQQLNLGLDLKGGMSVIMQVDLQDMVYNLSKESSEPSFTEALKEAKEEVRVNGGNFIEIFGNKFNTISNGASLYPIFKTGALRDQLNFESTNDEIIRLLREEADEAVNLTYVKLKERIDRFGVLQPNITLDPVTDRILVELPGVENATRAREMLQKAANLEFWKTYRSSDPGIYQGFVNADAELAKIYGETEGEDNYTLTPKMDTVYKLDADGNVVKDSLGNSLISAVNPTGENDTIFNPSTVGPLFDLLMVNPPQPSSYLGAVLVENKPKVDSLLNNPAAKSQFPADLEFKWDRKSFENPDTKEKMFNLFAIKTERKKTAPLQGGNVIDAKQDLDPETGSYLVNIKMDEEGKRIWGRMTNEAVQQGNREIAILMDGEVISAPSVQSAITDGNSRITGNFGPQESRDLAQNLEIGKLPANPEIISEALVGPSLGQANINRSLTALGIGFAMVFMFMIFYYNRGGIFSILALLLNLFFIFASLASFGTVLTLPGIAGVILTIGMAVDANVIIYERIKEELLDGKSTVTAIRDGFSNSYSAIIDANVTTILVALMLFYFGVGPIKGFATVLIVGVILSLFTAVLVARLFIDWWTVTKGNELSFTSSLSDKFTGFNVDWLSKRKVAYVVSGAIILAGLISMGVRSSAFEYGVDFKGGYAYSVEFPNSPDLEAVKASLAGPLEGSGIEVKTFGDSKTLEITTSYKIEEAGSQEIVKAALYEGLKSFDASSTFASFTTSDSKGMKLLGFNKINPSIASDISRSALFSAIFALLCIFLYIFLRFRKWQYSMGAVAALFHDVLIVLSIFSIFQDILPFSMEIDQNFIAAILTVIGYSINDTVIVFDRIREFFGRYVGLPKEEVINKAVNTTLSRTVITSVTTLFVVLVLFIFGAGEIQGFAFALLIGIVVGTYSSIFIATPVLSDLSGDTLVAEQTGSTKKTKRIKV